MDPAVISAPIFALMISLSLLVAEPIDHELREPESEQPCSCDPHLEAYSQYAGQSFQRGEPAAAKRRVVVVDDDYREQEGDLTRPATR